MFFCSNRISGMRKFNSFQPFPFFYPRTAKDIVTHYPTILGSDQINTRSTCEQICVVASVYPHTFIYKHI